MAGCLFHVFRNTPLGREIFLQSIYFCNLLGLSLSIYIPESRRFFLQFDHDTIAVDLDRSYLTSPENAFLHSKELVATGQVKAKWIMPDSYTDSKLPRIQNAFDFMCCPRSMQNGSAKIRLGHIGAKVRRILSAAPFPLLISSPVFKPWRKVALFYDGSRPSADVLHLGLQIGEISKLPIDIFTPRKSDADKYLRQVFQNTKCSGANEKLSFTCQPYDASHFIEDLYAVSHQALVIVKCSTNGIIRAYSSTMEKIQSTIPNNLLIVGPKYRPRIRLKDGFERFYRKLSKQSSVAAVH